MGTLLWIISIALVAAVTPLCYTYGLVRTMINNNILQWIRVIDRYHYTLAVSFDQTGNVFATYLFSDIMIKSSGHKFGNPDETVSSVLGKNQMNKTLTWLGLSLVWVLDKIDRNHSIDAIEEDE